MKRPPSPFTKNEMCPGSGKTIETGLMFGVNAVWATCPDCGRRISVGNEHHRLFRHAAPKTS